jgi:6-phosphogluconate dehydrogenase
MELGMIGLGKMGGFMTERLIRGGHRVIGFDRDPAVVQKRPRRARAARIRSTLLFLN